MAFIQTSPVVSHGFLSDVACQIDSRFVLKITDFGFPSLRQDTELELVYNEQEDRDYHSLLWRAPEHLRRRMPPSGTPKGHLRLPHLSVRKQTSLSTFANR